MPAKAKIRPSRIDVEPPARSSVRAIAPCAPRAKSSDAMAATAATGIAQTASRSTAPGTFRVASIAAGMIPAATTPKRKASQARWFDRRGCIRVCVRTAKSAGHCRRPQDGELIGDLQAWAAEAVNRRRSPASAPVAPPLTRVLEQAAPEQDALQVGRAHRMPERGRVEIAKLGERERPGREREAEIRVRELPAQPLTGAAEDLLVVVGEVGQLVERMPARVLGHLRVHPTRDEPEKRGRELAPCRVPVRVAPRLSPRPTRAPRPWSLRKPRTRARTATQRREASPRRSARTTIRRCTWPTRSPQAAACADRAQSSCWPPLLPPRSRTSATWACGSTRALAARAATPRRGSCMREALTPGGILPASSPRARESTHGSDLSKASAWRRSRRFVAPLSSSQ